MMTDKKFKRRRRTGVHRPIDFSSFPTDESLLLYIKNLEYHVKKGVGGQIGKQYRSALTEAHERGLDVKDVSIKVMLYDEE